jgi:hypothetical protein
MRGEDRKLCCSVNCQYWVESGYNDSDIKEKYVWGNAISASVIVSPEILKVIRMSRVSRTQRQEN